MDEELLKPSEVGRPDLFPLFAMFANDAYNSESVMGGFFPAQIPLIRNWVGNDDSRTFARSYEWNDVVVVAVRGTESISQFLTYLSSYAHTPLSWGGGAVYCISNDYYAQIASKAIEFAPFLRNKKIILTGHSMGGSLAKVAASHLKSLSVDNVSVITFATPFLETRSFRDNNSFHCTNIRFRGDGIAYMPFPIMIHPRSALRPNAPDFFWVPKSYGMNYFLNVDYAYNGRPLRGRLEYAPQPSDDEWNDLDNLTYVMRRAAQGITGSFGNSQDGPYALRFYRAGYRGAIPLNPHSAIDALHRTGYYIGGTSLAAACMTARVKFVYDALPYEESLEDVVNNHLGKIHPDLFWNPTHWRQGEGFISSPWASRNDVPADLAIGLENYNDASRTSRDQLDALARSMGHQTYAAYLQAHRRY